MSQAMRWAAVMLAVGIVADAPVVGATIRGQVTTEGGGPGAGAQVWAVKLWIQELERHEVTADAAGRFAIEVASGGWLIEATLGDQGSLKDGFVQVEGRDPDPVTIPLGPPSRLRGRLVAAETGAPIVGGRLVIDNGVVPVSAGDGRFEVAGLSRARYHESFVVAAGRERQRVLFEMAEGPVTDLEIPVPRGGKATGRVLDAVGKPVAGAFVGKSTSGSIISLTGLWIRTDGEGRFEYDGLPLGRTTWLNTVAEGAEDARRDDLRANLDGSPIAVDFRLDRSLAARRLELSRPDVATRDMAPKADNRRTVSGVVTGPDGKAVGAAKVRWGLDMSSDPDIETKTDAEGKFRLSLLPPNAEIVCVVPERPDLAPATVTVGEAGDQEIPVKLDRGRTLAGVVRDEAGAPLAGVQVIPTVLGVGRRGYYLLERKTKTDAHGRFQVEGLPDAPLSFSFLGDGLGDLRDHRLGFAQENAVVLSASGGIRGKVVDATGRSVRNFRVLLNGPRHPEPGDKIGSFFAGFCAPGLTYSSTDGTFQVRDLGVGTVQRVTILAPGHGEETLDRVVAGPLNLPGPGAVITFELAPANSFQVRVIEAGSRKPIPNALALLTHGNSTFQPSSWDDSVHATTDAAGMAMFTPLSYSEAMVLVQAPGFAQEHQAWNDHSSEVVVALKPGAVVAGELLDDETGRPLDRAIVHLNSAQTGPATTTLQPGDLGRFRFGELPAGVYNLSITTNDHAQMHQEQLTLEAGQQATRPLRLSPARAIPQNTPGLVVAPLPRSEPVLKVGDPAPDFTASMLDGKPLSLKDFRGKYVLLDFWATWCGPCVAELPAIRDVHEAFGTNPKFAMISLSLDAEADTVTKFLKDHPEPWPQVFLGDWSNDPVTKRYGVDAIPSLWLVDPEGKIVARDLRGKGIKEAVAQVLKSD